MAKPGERIFGFWTLAFLVIANMIGAGVFTTSGFTLESLRDPRLVLLAWLVGGVIALCGAYSYGLLVQRIPVSGGEYAFLSRAAHPFLGYVAGWISMLAGFSGAIAFAAVTLEAYLDHPLPPNSIALSVVAFGAVVHGLKRSVGTLTQNLAVLLKLVLLLTFLGVAGWSATTGAREGEPLPATTEPIGLLFAQSLVWISLSYSGFNAGVYVAGESMAPQKLGRALLVGTAITTVLYLLLNAAFVLIPPTSEMAGKADIAAQAAQWIGDKGFATFVRLTIALALFTSILSMMMAGPRVYARMAEDGLLPKAFRITPERPWPPVLLQAGLAVFLILVGSVQSLLAYLGLTLSLCAAASVSCLFFGDVDQRLRGMKAIVPLVFVTATLLAAILLLIRDPWQGLGTAITVAIGAIAFLAHSRWSAT